MEIDECKLTLTVFKMCIEEGVLVCEELGKDSVDISSCVNEQSQLYSGQSPGPVSDGISDGPAAPDGTQCGYCRYTWICFRDMMGEADCASGGQWTLTGGFCEGECACPVLSVVEAMGDGTTDMQIRDIDCGTHQEIPGGWGGG